MKFLKKIVVLPLALLLLLFCAACSSETLDAPAGLNMNESYTLFWRTVTGARSYTVEITDVNSGDVRTENSRRTYISLQNLPEGNYEIRVRAVGGAGNNVLSPWSQTQEFERERESGLIYTLINSNTEYEVTKIGTAGGAVEIKEKYRGKPITSIAEGAFRGRGNSRLESIVVGPRVTSIGANAFYGCANLTSVTLPDTVNSIGESAFQACSALVSVNIPTGISFLPAYTFAYCRSLKEIALGENITALGESAFYGCSALEEIVLPDACTYIGPYAFGTDTALERVEMGSGVETVDSYAFYKCEKLSELVFGKEYGPFTIGTRAFADCTELKSAVLPEGLTELGGYSFYNSGLKSVSLPETLIHVGEFSFNGTELYNEQAETGSGFIYADDWLVAVTTEKKNALVNFLGEDLDREVVGIADETFVLRDNTLGRGVGCPLLETVILPVSVRYIGEYAFYASPSLIAVGAPEGSKLTRIFDRAFQNCYRLGQIRFGDCKELKDIGSYVFYNCTVLDNPTNRTALIPENVERVGTQAFYNTLIYRYAPERSNGIMYAGNWVVGFNNITNELVELEDGIVGIADYAFYECVDITGVSGLNNVRRIGRGAFNSCTRLASVSLNRNLRRIEDYTFDGCTELIDVDFPSNLEYIGIQAFNECTGLHEIDLGRSRVSEIGAYAFNSCYNVQSVTLPDTLETIGDLAFFELKILKELSFPDSLTTIGARAFAKCSALETVRFGEGLERVGDYAFTFCDSLTEVSLPAGVREVGEYAFYKCISLVSLSLGRVERIGTYAFACTAIGQAVIPSSVTYMGSYAFKNCKELTSVIMEGTPAYIGPHAFFGDSYLTLYLSGARDGTELWSGQWNSSFRPVLFEAVLSEEGYVISVTASEEKALNRFAQWGISPPAREGFEFVGWAKEENATEAEFGAGELFEAEPDTVLYAVYRQQEQTESPA